MKFGSFDHLVRIKRIEFENFRNIEKGSVVFPNSKTQDFANGDPAILGLYGQNGSGKTSVIMALGILKDVLSGKPLSEKYMSAVRNGCDRCALRFEFTLCMKTITDEGETRVDEEEGPYFDVFYDFEIAKRFSENAYESKNSKSAEDLVIENEVFKYRNVSLTGQVEMPKRTFLSTQKSSSKKKRFFGSDTVEKFYQRVNSEFIQTCREIQAITTAKSQSFVFSSQLMKLLNETVRNMLEDENLRRMVSKLGDTSDYTVTTYHAPDNTVFTGENQSTDEEVLDLTESANKFLNLILLVTPLSLIGSLRKFGLDYLHVIDTVTTGLTNINTRLPLLLWANIPNQGVHNYRYSLLMDGPSQVPEKSFQTVKLCLEAVSDVLEKIVPGVRLNFEDYGVQLSSEAEQEHYFEITSQRGETVIPLKYESDGIRRIVSILSLLIAVYNDPSFTVAIDEIDSGIFEYLLGEILAIMADSVKGQLIFTSHNLRPLEVLPSKFLCFTTTDPEKRFTSIAARGNSNLRDTYFRSIVLNTHKDSVYNPTDRYEIELALYKAGHLEEMTNE